MAPPSRPPGREREGGPVANPSRPITTPPPSRREDIHSLTGGGDIDAEVAARLWELHWHHGYFTRAEIEAALGASDAA